jgi:hypothetical protein
MCRVNYPHDKKVQASHCCVLRDVPCMIAFWSMPFILWIHAKPATSAKARSPWHVLEKQLYTTTVKRALASSGVVPARFRLELHEHSSPKRWQSAFEHLDSHVVGLCLVDASRIPDPYAYLSGPERQLSDYWKQTVYGPLRSYFIPSSMRSRSRFLYMYTRHTAAREKWYVFQTYASLMGTIAEYTARSGQRPIK